MAEREVDDPLVNQATHAPITRGLATFLVFGYPCVLPVLSSHADRVLEAICSLFEKARPQSLSFCFTPKEQELPLRYQKRSASR